MQKIVVIIIIVAVVLAIFGSILSYTGFLSFLGEAMPYFAPVFTTFTTWIYRVVETVSQYYYINFVVFLFVSFFFIGSLFFYLLRGGKHD